MLNSFVLVRCEGDEGNRYGRAEYYCYFPRFYEESKTANRTHLYSL